MLVGVLISQDGMLDLHVIALGSHARPFLLPGVPCRGTALDGPVLALEREHAPGTTKSVEVCPQIRRNQKSTVVTASS